MEQGRRYLKQLKYLQFLYLKEYKSIVFSWLIDYNTGDKHRAIVRRQSKGNICAVIPVLVKKMIVR